jgi:hypothetical protein
VGGSNPSARRPRTRMKARSAASRHERSQWWVEPASPAGPWPRTRMKERSSASRRERSEWWVEPASPAGPQAEDAHEGKILRVPP